jgi:NTP pyrophosphatase (non-canonical NTP hydrolase)
MKSDQQPEQRDNETTIQELKNLIVQFRDERGWKKHHTPKNLAMSIAIEAAELMEHFQWDEYSPHTKKEVADELADILVYAFDLADILDIDIATSMRDKVRRVSIKFPVELFNPGNDNAEEYIRIKKAYRAGGEPKESK